ncbi:MAG: hypothetical protein JWQ71_2988 [Pedosphaera sp.]|nr:hypothetical protein [Pedosphaera sp.]
MQPRRAFAQEFGALLRGVIDTERGGGLVVIGEFLEAIHELAGEFGAAEGGDAFDLAGADNRQDAGKEGDVDAEFADKVVAEFKIVGVVVKQLGNDKVSAAINLLLQVIPIDMFALGAGDVAFRETGGANGESAQFAQETDELMGIFKAALGPGELAVAAGRVAAQGQDVGDAECAGLLNDVAKFLAGGVDAGEMEHGRQSMLALDAVHDHQRLVARPAARAIGDRTEIRLEFEQGRDGLFQEGAVAFIGLGWEKFEGDNRLAQRNLGRVDVADELHQPMICRKWGKKKAGIRGRPSLG